MARPNNVYDYYRFIWQDFDLRIITMKFLDAKDGMDFKNIKIPQKTSKNKNIEIKKTPSKHIKSPKAMKSKIKILDTIYSISWINLSESEISLKSTKFLSGNGRTYKRATGWMIFTFFAGN